VTGIRNEPKVERVALTRRAASVDALANERFDVLIVGGGIVGTGALLDAMSRGLRAALIEQSDIASGTSGRSSRLIHGGLRYLEQLHFGLVAEALGERSRLLRNAPHLVRLLRVRDPAVRPPRLAP
jgi:glycerol-3-phosphate dehydrogenase